MKEMLFEVQANELRIEKFKREHQIETHHANVDEMPWAALHMPSARNFGYGVTEKSDIFDCVAKVGRLLDESGVMGYGKTEADAILETCRACGVEVKPSDL